MSQLDAFESLLQETVKDPSSPDVLAQNVIDLAAEALGPSEDEVDATLSTGYMHEPFAIELLQSFIDALADINAALLSPEMAEKRELYLALLCGRKAEIRRAERLANERIEYNRQVSKARCGQFVA